MVDISDAIQDGAEQAPSRRTVLTAGVVLAGAGVASLAGCASSKKTGTAAGFTNSASPSATSSSAVLTPVSSVPVGNALSLTYQNGPILVSQPEAGKIVAFSAICTHQGCTVLPAGKQFHCPCHGSVYDAATGAVISGPAPTALSSVAVHVDAGNVIAGA